MSRPRPTRLIAAGVSLPTVLCACAVPATQVEVPTMSMRNAFEMSHPAPSVAPPPERLSRAVAVPASKATPQPMLSSPDVRLAYLYEWVDAEGNKHFGEWVAIPVAGFDWIMSDGAHEAMDGSEGVAAPAQEAR